MKVIQNKAFQVFILFALVFAAYFPIITAHQKTDPDAKNILMILEESGNVSGYISKIMNLDTLDVQPLRDLSLSIDLYFLKNFDINSFVFQNVLWWVLSCFFLMKILESLFPDIDERKRFAIVLAFAAYPLFSNTVAWGMARKHLMALCFLLVPTWRLTASRNSILFKDQIVICIFYGLSMLSQPIGVLWPFWAGLYVYFLRPELKRSFVSVFIGLIAIFLATYAANTYYYSQSEYFLKRYPSRIFPPKLKGWPVLDG